MVQRYISQYFISLMPPSCKRLLNLDYRYVIVIVFYFIPKVTIIRFITKKSYIFFSSWVSSALGNAWVPSICSSSAKIASWLVTVSEAVISRFRALLNLLSRIFCFCSISLPYRLSTFLLAWIGDFYIDLNGVVCESKFTYNFFS